MKKLKKYLITNLKSMLKKLILKWLFQTKALKFETWKSPTHLEQYTRIKFLDKELITIKWSELDKLIYNLTHKI